MKILTKNKYLNLASIVRTHIPCNPDENPWVLGVSIKKVN